MRSVATVKLKIPQRAEFLETMRQYSKSAQEVVDCGWELVSHDKRELHDLTYRSIRKMTQLPAQLVCSSRNRACDTLRAGIGKGKKPVFREFLAIRYDARSFSFKDGILSLSTINGRVKFKASIPDYFRKYDKWKVCSADMIHRKNGLFLNIAVSNDIEIITDSNKERIGIDVGINNLAVTSKRRFFNGKMVKTKRIKYARLRRKLQAKGTRGAKRLLRKVSGREKRFMAWVNHNISKEIVGNTSKGSIIVMEKLTNIRKQRRGKRLNFWLNSWSFFQLQSFIEYKALAKGNLTVRVNPKDTSKTCSRCGSLHTSRSKSFFKCLHCNYSLNADLNASFNLANWHSMPDANSGAVNHPCLTDANPVKSHLTC